MIAAGGFFGLQIIDGVVAVSLSPDDSPRYYNSVTIFTDIQHNENRD